MRQFQRNFDRIAQEIDVAALRHQIIRNWKLWNQHDFRTEYPGTPHVDVDDILVRYTAPESLTTTTKVMGDDKPVFYPAVSILTEVKPLVRGIMNMTGAHDLGRVIISRIPPGGQILAHRDSDGEYVLQDDIARYHLVIQGTPGNLYRCGEGTDQSPAEEVHMLTGELWWFNAHHLHSVVNEGEDDRIHLMVDVRTGWRSTWG